MLRKFIPIACLLLILTACNNKKMAENSGDMAQFAEDSAFKDAHPSPDSIAYQAKGKMVEFETPDGKKGSAYALMAAVPTQNYLLVIQEWWGLNEFVKRASDLLFDSLGNTNVLALDMYDGKIATNADQAGEFMGMVTPERGIAIVNGALRMAGKEAKVATLGWCFGGGWSLQSSILAGTKGVGCVMYYGMPVENAKELAPLKADVLGIFAKKDKWITPEVVSKFEALAKATGKKVEIRQFEADHAFANPSQPSFDQKAAQEANALALNFLREKLK